jgi:hypothetical protein
VNAATFADHRTADEVTVARGLACQARGCPMPWTIDSGGSRLCSAHAGALPREWPAITERLLWQESDRARRAAAAPAPVARGPLAAARLRPSAEQIAALRACRDEAAATAETSPRALLTDRWLALRERERAGQSITQFQADAWRAALRMAENADAWAPAWFERPADRPNG